MPLTSNDMTREVAANISRNPIPWDLVFQLYEQTNAYRNTQQNGGQYSISHLKGLLTELAIRASLASVTWNYSGAIKIDPLLLDTESTTHKISYKDFRLYVTDENSKRGDKSVCEIDISATIDNLLVFFDVTLQSYDWRNIENLVSDKRRRKLEEIAIAHGHSDFGYILIVPRETEGMHYPLIHPFEKKGGLVITLPTDKKEFIRKMKEEWEKRMKSDGAAKQ